ncbi:MAG: hypothetical protein K9M08_20070 [Pirellula sp.]|nr:hypothetical protein [Pirellula sp.]
MAEQIRSANQMVKMFAEDASLLARLKTDPNPIAVLQETASQAEAKSEPAYRADKMLYRIAVIVLGLLALLAAIGSIGLVAAGKTTPEVVGKDEARRPCHFRTNRLTIHESNEPLRIGL